MAAPRIPGNEPDGNDMAREPGGADEALGPQPLDPGLAEEDEAAKLGDFA